MKFILVLITGIILINTPCLAVTAGQPNVPQKAKECAPKDHACKVDRNIDEFEQEVVDIKKEYYDKGSVWDVEGLFAKCEEKNLTKCTAGKILKIPSYIGRVVTWPVAPVTHFLIKKGVIRKVVNVVSNKKRTLWVYPKLELGFGSGFGGGVGITNLDVMDQDYRLDAEYVINVNLNQRASMQLYKPDAAYIGDRAVAYWLRSGFNHVTNYQFYGVGPNSSKNNIAYAGVDSTYGGGDVGFTLINKLRFEAGAELQGYATGKPSGVSPSIDKKFGKKIIGFDDNLLYARVGLKLEHDDRNAFATPDKGGLQTLSVYRYQGIDSTIYDYLEYKVELLQYLRLWIPRHVLALRNAWTFQDTTGKNGVPFFKLASLDINSPARGFSTGRFRDRGSVVFNVEYRYPIWKYMDGDFFFDTGRVFNGIKKFAFDDFRFSGGGGLRLRTTDFFLMRIEIAYGGEGVKAFFKTSQAF